MLENISEEVRRTMPLVHCITNYVTVNDCANVLLACGASPVMADDGGECEEITGLSRALLLNIGTLNTRTVESMLLSGRRAAILGLPIVLDPVGAGASRLRTETALRLLRELPIGLIRCNMSELKAIAGESNSTCGVDAAAADAVTGETLERSVELVRKVAIFYKCTVSVSGALDIVADANSCFLIENGVSAMTRITGCGCMLSALSAAFTAIGGDYTTTELAAAAAVEMGICGEAAYKQMLTGGNGNSSMRNFLIDNIYNFGKEDFVRNAKYSKR